MEVEYFDAAPGRLSLEFDRSDTNAPFRGKYTKAPEVVPREGARHWRKAQFTLHGARFTIGQNRGADFRLSVNAPEFGVGTVTLLRSPGSILAAIPLARDGHLAAAHFHSAGAGRG